LNPFIVDKFSSLESPVHSLDARVKIISFMALVIVAVSTPPEYFMAFAAYALILIAAIAISKVPLQYFAMRLLVILPFIVLVAIAIPFVHTSSALTIPGIDLNPANASRSGWMILWNVTVKAFIAITALSVMSATTTFPDFIKGLEHMRVPRALIMPSVFMYRYIFVLIDEALRMKRAADSRLYEGRWLRHAGTIGRMIGTLFLRSYERGERVYAAMIARGFDGSMPSGAGTQLRAADFAFLSIMLALTIAVRIGSSWIHRLYT
jgi:cobalt/nickel transport system permease protein